MKEPEKKPEEDKEKETEPLKEKDDEDSSVSKSSSVSNIKARFAQAEKKEAEATPEKVRRASLKQSMSIQERLAAMKKNEEEIAKSKQERANQPSDSGAKKTPGKMDKSKLVGLNLGMFGGGGPPPRKKPAAGASEDEQGKEESGDVGDGKQKKKEEGDGHSEASGDEKRDKVTPTPSNSTTSLHSDGAKNKEGDEAAKPPPRRAMKHSNSAVGALALALTGKIPTLGGPPRKKESDDASGEEKREEEREEEEDIPKELNHNLRAKISKPRRRAPRSKQKTSAIFAKRNEERQKKRPVVAIKVTPSAAEIAEMERKKKEEEDRLEAERLEMEKKKEEEDKKEQERLVAEKRARLQEEERKRKEEARLRGEAMRGFVEDGAEFIKHGRKGKPHVKEVFCLADGFLYWCDQGKRPKDKKKGAGKSIDLRNVRKLTGGKLTDAFKRSTAKDAKEEHCFSVADGERTLDLEAKSEEERDQWLESLHHMYVLALASGKGKKK